MKIKEKETIIGILAKKNKKYDKDLLTTLGYPSENNKPPMEKEIAPVVTEKKTN